MHLFSAIHTHRFLRRLFSPETSCERGNKYLDRSTLVSTFAETDKGFFGD